MILFQVHCSDKVKQDGRVLTVFSGPEGTKASEGRFRGKKFYSHLKHLQTIRHREILCSIFQEKSVFYGPENTVVKVLEEGD
jgi:hypothetical protein